MNRPIKQIQTGIVLKAHDSSLGQKTTKLLINLTENHSVNQMGLRYMVDVEKTLWMAARRPKMHMCSLFMHL